MLHEPIHHHPPHRSHALRYGAWLVLVLAALLVIAGSAFVRKYFGPVTPEQLMYHLQQGGMDQADPKLMARALRYLGGTMLIALALAWALRRRHRRWHALALLGLTAGATGSVLATLDNRCAGGGDPLAEYYVDPASVALQPPARAPDILLVFFESLEDTHADAKTMGEDLAPALDAWDDSAQRFGRMHQAAGATWTMGGIFASLCGLPLKPVGLAAGNGLEFSQRFFSRGQCLTDLLARQGYEATFYGGASLRFAGKGKFLAAHGVARRFGREEWRARGVPADTNAWGLADSDLARAAWADMQRPRPDARPRLHILLTVDTHPPTGFADPACAETAGIPGDDNPTLMREAFQCTDEQVAGLVKRFLAAEPGRDKLVWVQGDHLAMRNVLDPALERSPQRSIYHAMALQRDGQAVPPQPLRRDFTHFDVLPTLLLAAGFQWPDPQHRLGMGVALQGPRASAPTLVERLGPARLDGSLACHSPRFAELW